MLSAGPASELKLLETCTTMYFSGKTCVAITSFCSCGGNSISMGSGSQLNRPIPKSNQIRPKLSFLIKKDSVFIVVMLEFLNEGIFDCSGRVVLPLPLQR